MVGAKILIFLIILVVATFAIRFLGTMPVNPQTSPGATSTQTNGVPVTSPQSGGTTAPLPTGNSGGYTPPPASEQIPSQDTAQPVQPPLPVVDPSEIPQGFTLSQLSPYFHKVRLAGVALPGEITLSAALDEGASVNITGWLVKARQGGQFVPRAINIYDPTGYGPETDINLKPNDTLYMFSSVSAIGKNFRLNKCIGFLENENDFTPGIPGYCQPLYKDYSEISAFTGKCQDYISSLSSCTPPDIDYGSTEIPQDDYACKSYIQNNIGFRGCFNKYRSDADFLTNDIWAWTGNDHVFDERHDRVFLFDKAGLLVDEYSY